MGGFSIRYPYFVVVCFLIISVIGLSSVVRMPVDLFPPIKIPVVVVATFYSGMPAEEIETSITGRFERFFTLGSGIEHIESRSLPGVSLIKIYFQPGMDADAAVTEITNLAMADLRKLPAGTLPPVVLKFDASSLPVCLVTLKGDVPMGRAGYSIAMNLCLGELVASKHDEYVQNCRGSEQGLEEAVVPHVEEAAGHA